MVLFNSQGGVDITHVGLHCPPVIKDFRGNGFNDNILTCEDR